MCETDAMPVIMTPDLKLLRATRKHLAGKSMGFLGVRGTGFLRGEGGKAGGAREIKGGVVQGGRINNLWDAEQ
jgi:hypothetical protein